MYVHFDKNYSLFISFQIKFLKLPYLWIYIFFNFKKYSVHKVSFTQLCFHSICELVIGKYKMGPIYNNLLYIYLKLQICKSQFYMVQNFYKCVWVKISLYSE